MKPRQFSAPTFSGTFTFERSDARRHEIATLDSMGAVRSIYRYGDFGAPTSYSFGPPTGLDPTFGGMRYLNISGTPAGAPPIAGWPQGLYLGMYRLYDPYNGVWLSQDSLGYVDSPNRSAYVAQNPIDFIDPLGLSKRDRQKQKSKTQPDFSGVSGGSNNLPPSESNVASAVSSPQDVFYDRTGRVSARTQHDPSLGSGLNSYYFIEGGSKAPISRNGKHYYQFARDSSDTEPPIDAKMAGRFNVNENSLTELTRLAHKYPAKGHFEVNISLKILPGGWLSPLFILPTSLLGNLQEVLDKSRSRGLWDFKWNRNHLRPESDTLSSNTIYILEGRAYMADVAGNVIWGHILAESGWPEGIAQNAAGFYQNWSGSSNMSFRLSNFPGDDPRDSYAIDLGYRISMQEKP